MTTLSIPVDNTLMQFIDSMIASHKAESKTQVVRRALYNMREDEALKDIAEAHNDIIQGKVYSGDLRTLASTIE